MPVVGPIPSPGPYPVIEDVFNLTRVIVDDAMAGSTGTLGEGRIITDNWIPLLTILNNAILEYQRDLESHGVETLRKEVVLTPITPINGPLGLGVTDPACWQYLSYLGLYDGSVLKGPVALPPDMMVPLRVWSRMAGNDVSFEEVYPASAGLQSIRQGINLGRWEWRGDAIWWNGSVVSQDVRIRYQGRVMPYPLDLSPGKFKTTQLPFADCLDALAYKCAYHVCAPRLPAGGAGDLLEMYNLIVGNITNARGTRPKQRTRYARPGYGDEEDYPFWY